MRRTAVALLGVIAVVLAPCATGEEVLPLNVGEVLVPTGRKWECTGANANCTIEVQDTPGVVSLRHYGLTGAGKFSMSHTFKDLKCSGFDTFLVFLTNRPERVKVSVTLQTDAGERKSAEASIAGDWCAAWTELPVKLDGAKTIRSIRIDFTLEKEGRTGTGVYLQGLFLRNSQEFAAFQKHWERFSKLTWDGLLQPADYEPTFRPQYGLFFKTADVERYRERHDEHYQSCIKGWLARPAPEGVIDRNIYASEQTRAHLAAKYAKVFGRPGIALRGASSYLAFGALVAKDKELMRLAARYILTVASFEYWHDKPTNDVVGGGVWPAFTPSGVATELAVALDCAGEMLTARGRGYVLKAMMLKGVGPITYSMWARQFGFHSNQGMVFLRGKMASLLVFDKVWPRIGPMVDYTKAEADECMNTIFRADGSYMESFAYMSYTITCAAPLYEMYASMMGKPLAEVLPENLSKSAGFADVVSSTNRHEGRAIITFGQAHVWSNMHPPPATFLAAAVPDSMWVNLYKRIKPDRMANYCVYPGMASGIRLEKLRKIADKHKPAKPKPLVVLTESGLVSSTRYLDGQPVKIVIVGDSLGMGKKHNDSGSFVLEFVGDTFAMDMPVYTGLCTEAQYHNMLVAVATDGKLANSIYYTDSSLYHDAEKRNSQRPTANGDERRFSGKMSPSAAWDAKYLQKSVRTIESPTPDVIKIRDEYKVGAEATGVAFVWLTYLPAVSKDGKIIITGEYGGRVELTPPEGCAVEVERFSPGPHILKGMSLPEDHQCSRIIIRKSTAPNAEGRLEVNARLVLEKEK